MFRPTVAVLASRPRYHASLPPYWVEDQKNAREPRKNEPPYPPLMALKKPARRPLNNPDGDFKTVPSLVPISPAMEVASYGKSVAQEPEVHVASSNKFHS